MARRIAVSLLAAAAVLACAIAGAGCGGSDDADGGTPAAPASSAASQAAPPESALDASAAATSAPAESAPAEEVVITCSACQESPTDPFLQFNHDAVEQFNEAYAGRYRVDVVENQNAGSGPDRLQHYQRLALADDLPDLFLVNRGELETLQTSGKLLDFAPALAEDQTWADSFYPGSFDALTDDAGHVWAVPQQRDAIGIFWNRALFQEAGIEDFPATWEELRADCELLEEKGKICMAMDGNWVTLLMWANLIGTQDGGPEFLSTGIRGADYASNPAVVKATEFLAGLQKDGFVNSDSSSGDYQNAAAPFLRGEAAMVANGPWMVAADIKGPDASPDLYPNISYAPSPGWTPDHRGLIVVAGNGGWVSGSTDPDKIAAVTEFMKFVTSRDLSLQQTEATGAYPAVQVEPTAEETAKLEPLAAGLVAESTSIPATYPHAYFASPASFAEGWLNGWPAYVQGEMSTEEFLAGLTEGTGS